MLTRERDSQPDKEPPVHTSTTKKSRWCHVRRWSVSYSEPACCIFLADQSPHDTPWHDLFSRCSRRHHGPDSAASEQLSNGHHSSFQQYENTRVNFGSWNGVTGLFLAPFRWYRIQENTFLLALVEDLKLVYLVVTFISFYSELLAVTWATVAVNQLAECDDLAPTDTAWGF
eukprot:scaffold1033_cov171-Amphora_coffeaeformis.AAC.30